VLDHLEPRSDLCRTTTTGTRRSASCGQTARYGGMHGSAERNVMRPAAHRIAGICLDVTERRRVEEALQARPRRGTRSRTAPVLETATQGIVSVNAHGVIVTANCALEGDVWLGARRADRSVHRGPAAVIDRDMQVQHSHWVTIAAPVPLMRRIGSLSGTRKDGRRFRSKSASITLPPLAAGGRSRL
jgi:hypothetical protein